MNKKWLISVACFAVYLVTNIVQAETQEIVPSKTSFQAASGDIVEFDVNYSSSSPSQTTGLGLKLNYDSSKLTLVDVSDVFTTDKLAQAVGVKKIGAGKAKSNDPTDKIINIAWASLNGKWPGTENTNTRLLKIKFRVTKDLTSSSTINFTGNASAGNTFSAIPVTVTSITKTTASTNTETSTSQSPSTSGGGTVSWLMMLGFMLLLGVIKIGLGKKTNSN